jgi:hypothetical protein
VEGLTLTFHLAGINNQNFLMRDEETGTYWQQISGAAVSGPLAGRTLPPVYSDELTFALWKTEQPGGTVLRDAPTYAREYAPIDWDVRMKRARTVIAFPAAGIGQRDLMLGIRAFGVARAFPMDLILKEKLILDHVGGEPVLLVAAGDGLSVRVFHARITGVDGAPGFYRKVDQSALMDDATGSSWNFEGCAVEGKAKGVCLEKIEGIKDYWFDWRNYNPATSVYGQR